MSIVKVAGQRKRERERETEKSKQRIWNSRVGLWQIYRFLKTFSCWKQAGWSLSSRTLNPIVDLDNSHDIVAWWPGTQQFLQCSTQLLSLFGTCLFSEGAQRGNERWSFDSLKIGRSTREKVVLFLSFAGRKARVEAFPRTHTMLGCGSSPRVCAVLWVRQNENV